MRQTFLAALLAAGLLTVPAAARQTGAAERARELAARMTKTKHAVKEKHGVRVEKFKEIRSEAAVRTDPREYSGAYESEIGFRLRLTVGPEGRVEGSGTDITFEGARAPRDFTLRGARVESALLTGTKVFADGSTQSFEAVFINRTDRDSPATAGTTTFGIGVLYDPPLAGEGYAISRLFYQKR
ncbi:MAG TPA: hypothetical protein VGX48_23570 [Pyrinomonadaceae bacterium]|jgi:hypothetical protein|nr:hypothetical protein [Pyrinomonadaceae bacterium]